MNYGRKNADVSNILGQLASATDEVFIIKKASFYFQRGQLVVQIHYLGSKIKLVELDDILDSITKAYGLETSTICCWYDEYIQKDEFTTILTKHIDAIEMK